MKILLIGDQADAHIAAVNWGLKKMGYAPVIWSCMNFPSKSTSFISLANETSLNFEISDENYNSSENFDVIWNRRVSKPVAPLNSASSDHPIIFRESQSYTTSLIRTWGHSNARWVNRYDDGVIAGDKVLQLESAKKVGFKIPKTLVTNDFEKVRRFFDEQKEKIIYKGFRSATWVKADGSYTTLKTALVPTTAFDQPDTFKNCPGIYQELVVKKFEVRATVMGDFVLCGRIDSQNNGPRVDWRYDLEQDKIPLSQYDLPNEISARCVKLCRHLGLEFGCIDLIVNSDDEFIFLEVNQAGQFLWLEDCDPNINALLKFCEFLSGRTANEAESKEISLAAFDQSIDFKEWKFHAMMRKSNNNSVVKDY